MITREEIIWLGIVAGLSGSLVGGVLLGVGISLALAGVWVGLLLLALGIPAAAAIGWLLARRLASRLNGG
jgi:hypothetical protein